MEFILFSCSPVVVLQAFALKRPAPMPEHR